MIYILSAQPWAWISIGVCWWIMPDVLLLFPTDCSFAAFLFRSSNALNELSRPLVDPLLNICVRIAWLSGLERSILIFWPPRTFSAAIILHKAPAALAIKEKQSLVARDHADKLYGRQYTSHSKEWRIIKILWHGSMLSSAWIVSGVFMSPV